MNIICDLFLRKKIHYIFLLLPEFFFHIFTEFGDLQQVEEHLHIPLFAI